MSKKIYFWGIGVFVAVALLFFILNGKSAVAFEAINSFDGDITIYKSEYCGCCSAYVSYFNGKIESNVNVETVEDVNLIKNNLGVPGELSSCHTIKVGKYFVEGHVPLEAIEKLLREAPDIKGIALPGMPSGSPGMPGAKEPFVIYAVKNDGSTYEFLKL